MSLQTKTYLYLLVGGLAGLLTWNLIGVSKFLLSGGVFGLLLGLLFTVVESLAFASARRLPQLLLVGALLGFAGGWFGSILGDVAFQQICHLFGVDSDAPLLSSGQFFVLLIGRSLSYGFIGGLVGAAQGASQRSPLIARQGAFGGLIGGLLGGLSFEVTTALFDSPSSGRIIALTVTGTLVGFFIGLVQDLFKRAWIRVVPGWNGGKEYLITRPIITVGCSEIADIGLYGDPAIAPTHLVIEALAPNNRHRLRFAGEGGKRGTVFTPPLVNGLAVSGEQWLSDGDSIQIGGRTLLFHEKATRPEALSIQTPGRTSEKIGAGPTPLPLRYVGQELLETSTVPHSPLRTTPADVVAPTAVESTGDVTLIMGGQTVRLGSRLICIKGPYSGQAFPLSHAPVTIGRAPDRDIALPADTSISRTHARLVYQNGRHILSDDGSSNGTFVNGTRLGESRPLNPGDTLQLGDTALRYE